jgi:N-acetylneuraminic acid mutarotase
MGGSNVVNQRGEYGTQGTPSPNNIPGARSVAAASTDTSGNLWLFGGFGYDSAGTSDELNDLWKYSGGQWTWMGGADLIDRVGSYGTMGTPFPSNDPGARDSSMLWTDTAGKVWLFGGTGYDSAGTPGDLNDLWRYEP